ncbi:hypothetical protein C8F04DRAFT_1199867 [Mycena alexandri]|uniref:Uncharacterized protein n=1 Tax=Mycena alexandri TaxID=1745969 RepID=A0AAD6WMD2_9AGAR|nr:hypothetical protein C8F04DRAFT_1199867 [Mycena alexandri]
MSAALTPHLRAADMLLVGGPRPHSGTHTPLAQPHEAKKNDWDQHEPVEQISARHITVGAALVVGEVVALGREKKRASKGGKETSQRDIEAAVVPYNALDLPIHRALGTYRDDSTARASVKRGHVEALAAPPPRVRRRRSTDEDRQVHRARAGGTTSGPPAAPYAHPRPPDTSLVRARTHPGKARRGRHPSAAPHPPSTTHSAANATHRQQRLAARTTDSPLAP